LVKKVKNMSSRNIPCPRCDDFACRIKRTMINRLMSLFKSVKRYRCDFCGWEDTIVSGAAKQPNKK